MVCWTVTRAGPSVAVAVLMEVFGLWSSVAEVDVVMVNGGLFAFTAWVPMVAAHTRRRFEPAPGTDSP